MNLKKSFYVSFCLAFLSLSFVVKSEAQQRSRIVQTESQPVVRTESRPLNQPSTPAVRRTVMSSPTTNPAVRPTLTNKIVVVGQPQNSQPLVTKTSSSRATNSASNYTSLASKRLLYNSNTSLKMMQAIETLYGIPYLYGSAGPNRYDCSGFVWAVFQRAGIDFQRTSAKSLWHSSIPVEGDEKYKFGTLVFFNKLGHMGIVADENGFYQASSSKGITYSPFKGYWEKRIVGYRRLATEE